MNEMNVDECSEQNEGDTMLKADLGDVSVVNCSVTRCARRCRDAVEA